METTEKPSKRKKRRKSRKPHVRKGWLRYHLKRQCKTCYWCNTKLTIRTATLDHFIPISKGGPDKFENTVGACAKCNNAKSNMMPFEFIMKRNKNDPDNS